jgi:hypothetical protein
MTAKRHSLTPDETQQIEIITDTITTVPRELIQATKEEVFSTLENGNPLNRLIKDAQGNIIGFLAVQDETDAEGKKIAYLRATALLPREQRATKITLDEEVQKLIKRTKKL